MSTVSQPASLSPHCISPHCILESPSYCLHQLPVVLRGAGHYVTQRAPPSAWVRALAGTDSGLVVGHNTGTLGQRWAPAPAKSSCGRPCCHTWPSLPIPRATGGGHYYYWAEEEDRCPGHGAKCLTHPGCHACPPATFATSTFCRHDGTL